jgi:hypothetical protein
MAQIYVMLTVDLDQGVTTEQRKTFNEHLAYAHWVKLNLTTTWYARFLEGATVQGAIQAAKNIVAKAAEAARIAAYEAAAEVGWDKPVVWDTL